MTYDNLRTIDVVAAVRRSKNLYWMCRRSKNMKYSGMWEFPGGKVESGETLQNALIREMREEFNTDVDAKIGNILNVISSRMNDTDNTIYNVHFIEVEFLGKYTLMEHDASLWSTIEHLYNLPNLMPSGKTFLHKNLISMIYRKSGLQ